MFLEMKRWNTEFRCPRQDATIRQAAEQVRRRLVIAAARRLHGMANPLEEPSPVAAQPPITPPVESTPPPVPINTLGDVSSSQLPPSSSSSSSSSTSSFSFVRPLHPLALPHLHRLLVEFSRFLVLLPLLYLLPPHPLVLLTGSP